MILGVVKGILNGIGPWGAILWSMRAGGGMGRGMGRGN
jgi:hypothetical protein